MIFTEKFNYLAYVPVTREEVRLYDMITKEMSKGEEYFIKEIIDGIPSGVKIATGEPFVMWEGPIYAIRSKEGERVLKVISTSDLSDKY